jgi:serine/threonine protein phosphatase PrpC
MEISYNTITHVGHFRKNNEDYHVNDKVDMFDIFVLCDGMGGKEGGEIASKIAGDTIASFVKQNNKLPIKKLINLCFKHANTAILSEAKNNNSYDGMGTTVALAIKLKNQFSIGHIGDSRIYYIIQNKIEQLTKDHSLVQQLIEDGDITSEVAASHPMRNIITHALGSSFESSKNYFDLDFIPTAGSYILMCSDGLNNMINDKEILDAFSHIDPVLISEALVDKALTAGGKDNVTVTVIRIDKNDSDKNGLNNNFQKPSLLQRIFK